MARDLRRQFEDLQAETFLDNLIVARFHVLFLLGIGIEHLALAKFLFAGPLANGDVDIPSFAIAVDHERNGGARSDVRHEIGQRRFRRHCAVVDRQDDIARLKAGALGRLARLDRLHEFAAIAFKAERCGDIFRHRLDLHTQITALDLNAVTQLRDDWFCNFSGNGKADPDAAT